MVEFDIREVKFYFKLRDSDSFSGRFDTLFLCNTCFREKKNPTFSENIVRDCFGKHSMGLN